MDARTYRRKRKNRITLIVISSILGVMLIGISSVALYLWNGLRPAPTGEAVRVEVARGSSPGRVAETLEKEGIIRNSFIFKYYLRLKDEGPAFKAGAYELHPGMELDAIIAKLNSGDTLLEDTIRFTVPEGYTVTQMAERLAAQGLVDEERFLEVAASQTMLAASVSAGKITVSDQMNQLLEGYLFPETYELVKDSTEQDIITRMLTELDRKLQQLPEGWEDELETLGVSFHEMMTIASMIEREVVLPEERPVVAGIIYNRLQDNMMLQIDATVQYALGRQKDRLFESDLLIESPYNTYQQTGLPPGPIASPSLAAIEAALYPEDTEYFFYVTKKDGTSGHYFSVTYNEHLRNKRLSEANQ
ncbi:endolytic transglycosylase MltG [Paenibacillus daejeonensis]|uniref:endolytic transglycosylase MltG n=1 Tax=Paenibacillus daejeonensis TaxID=135193 RepID=UPI0003747EDD|nr:endolytic transglycosylase MltG [Paenibacillus daejeonensis]